MAKVTGKDVNFEEHAPEPKYASRNIYDYIAHKIYPVHADKTCKRRLTKCSKFLKHMVGDCTTSAGGK